MLLIHSGAPKFIWLMDNFTVSAQWWSLRAVKQNNDKQANQAKLYNKLHIIVTNNETKHNYTCYEYTVCLVYI